MQDLGRDGRSLTVAYAGDPMIYPLFGPGLRNRVTYVPTSAADRPQRVELRKGEGLTRRLAQTRRAKFDEAYWLGELRARRADLLYLVDADNTGGVADELAAVRRNPGIFEALFEEERVYLFRVKNLSIE